MVILSTGVKCTTACGYDLLVILIYIWFFRIVGTCSHLKPDNSTRMSFRFLVIPVVISLLLRSITFLSLCNSRSVFSTEYFSSRPEDLMYVRILDLRANAMEFTNLSPIGASIPRTFTGSPPVNVLDDLKSFSTEFRLRYWDRTYFVYDHR